MVFSKKYPKPLQFFHRFEIRQVVAPAELVLVPQKDVVHACKYSYLVQANDSVVGV